MKLWSVNRRAQPAWRQMHELSAGRWSELRYILVFHLLEWHTTALTFRLLARPLLSVSSSYHQDWHSWPSSLTFIDMALPAVETLFECSDWSKTVRPYLPQLHDLPQQIHQSWSDPTELKTIYLATNPLITGFVFSLALGPVFLLVSEINKNYSQVDRVWSILPTFYITHFVVYAHMSGLSTRRLDSLLAFSILWSVGRSLLHHSGTICWASQLRLTFNYWRRGGYTIGFEDYRW